jgi:acyl-coenzyme A synthetase/AMP-(fatty) acid ligase
MVVQQPTDTRQITYGEMVSEASLSCAAAARTCGPNASFSAGQTQRVCQYANVLKSKGIKKGDNVIIYMVRAVPNPLPAPRLATLSAPNCIACLPSGCDRLAHVDTPCVLAAVAQPMIPETAFAMLACARIGAVHSVVFAGFSAESLRARVDDAQAKMIMTADFGLRGPKSIGLKKIVDDSLATDGHCVETVLVFKRTGEACSWTEGRDVWLDGQREFRGVEGNDFAADTQRPVCPCEPTDAEDTLFLLYTSGSTGKPKGIQHTIAGYMLYTSITFEKTFNYQDGDLYACVADVGWITGHSYIVCECCHFLKPRHVRAAAQRRCDQLAS